MNKIILALCIFIAAVFIQSLFFKFTGSYETEHIFGTLAKWSGFSWFGNIGAYVIGIAELIASLLLFTKLPNRRAMNGKMSLRGLGSLLAFAIMSGAIFFHLFTPLGIVMPSFNESGKIIGNDKGLLFIMACAVWISALFITKYELQQEESILSIIKRRLLS